MSIRSRIGDFLFALLFPRQAKALEEVEDQLVDSAVACERARVAALDAQQAIADFRPAMEATRDLAMRVTRTGV